MPAGVEITPETEINFELSQSEATPKAVVTLKHPGGKSDGPLAFKVRYLMSAERESLWTREALSRSYRVWLW